MIDLGFYKMIRATTKTIPTLANNGYNVGNTFTNKKNINYKVISKHKDDYDIMQCFYHIYSIEHNEYFNKSHIRF